jgi:beta-mannosidase
LEKAGLQAHPCSVPGALETDLQSLGLVPDPFLGLNILEAQKWEHHHVWYGRQFRVEAAADTVAELVFEGIDCCAEIYLNGRHLGSTDNMLISHAFRVGNLLREENELLVHIRPAVLEAKRYAYPAGLAAQSLNYESLFIRKAPHMYGWDIMPRVVSAGLWRPVQLRFLPRERLDDIYLETLALSPDHTHADLTLHYQAITTGSARDRYEITVEGVCGQKRFAARQGLVFTAGRLKFGVDHPQLWWPRGSGEACLYEVTVCLLKNGVEIDRMRFNHGIRQVTLERTSVTNELGEGAFCFRVNGEKIFIKGTNWLPADVFHWRDPERIPRMLPLVLEIGCNLIRCWGGSVYEDDAFFDWCDRNGILVWQDFAMACAIYPQDDAFASRLAAEARQIVRRLRQHACVALWAGDNECDQAHAWHQVGDPNRNILTRRVLPELLKEEDPNRIYLPSSPFIDSVAYAKGDSYLTEDHLWGPRDYYKGDYYTKALCHFASETGYHGCPSVESLRQFLTPDKVWPAEGNDEWILHSVNPTLDSALYDPPDRFIRLMNAAIESLFGRVPDSLEDYVFASQAVQGEADKFFIERFRLTKWRRTGIIWWSLLDGWPAISAGVVDYYLRKKLAFDFIRRAQQDVCLMLREPEGGKQEIVAVNDTPGEVAITWSIYDVSGETVVASGESIIPPNGSCTPGHIPFDSQGQTLYRLTWENAAGLQGLNHYLAGFPPFDFNQYRHWLNEKL